ncbi:MAG: Ig-like domain-containing protein [Deltaproteobacteria bacterium]
MKRIFSLIIAIATICFMATFVSLPVMAEGAVGPKVVSTNPENGAIIKELPKYAGWPHILLGFSEPVKYIKSDGAVDAISVKDADGNKVDFYPAPGNFENDIPFFYAKLKDVSGNSMELTPNDNPIKTGKYTVYINEGYFVDADGNKNDAYSFSFTIGETYVPESLEVVSTSIKDGDINISVNPEVIIKFSKPIKTMNDDIVTTFTIENKDGNGYVGTAEIINGNVSIKPMSKLENGRKYVFTIYKDTFTDTDGNKNKEYSLSFTTVEENGATDFKVVSTNIKDGDINVSVNPEIIVRFSKPIKSIISNLTVDFLTADKEGNLGNTEIRDGVLYIKPENQLKNGKIYTVIIFGESLIDADGNKNEDYTFSFTTKNSEVNVITKPQFSDLPTNHWAYQAVEEMAKLGILNGYSDGTFRPNDRVTREEFATMMVRALNLPVVNPEKATFKDVNNSSWAYKYVESAKNYLTGYQKADGLYFKGRNNAVREDMAYALVKAQNLENQTVDISKLNSLFKDANKITVDLKKYVLIAYENEIVKGSADGIFNPKGTLTRAEAAQLLYNITSQDNDDSGKIIVK